MVLWVILEYQMNLFLSKNAKLMLASRAVILGVET
jgi:hypothetical protein